MARKYGVNITNFGSGAASTASAAVPGRAFAGLFVGIFNGPNGPLLLDATTFIRDGDFATDENGYADANLTLELSLIEQVRVFDAPGLRHVRISWNGITAYEGRLQSVKLRGVTVTLTAFGYRAALGDIPLTGPFSVSDVNGFKSVDKETLSGQNKDKYQEDRNNRLYATLKKNQSYVSAGDAYYAYIDVPDGSANQWKYVTARFTYNLPPNWRVRYIATDTSFASPVSSDITTTGGAAGPTTFTLDLSATPRDRLGVQVYNNSGSTFTNGQDDGVYFVQLDNIRVTSSDATVYADDVVDRLVSFINGINPTQLQASTALIQSPAVDLSNAVYEDTYPKDILNALITRGDTNVPPRVWEWGVWDNRYLHFRPRGANARELFVDVIDPQVERTLGGLTNSYYAVYRDASGRTLRTDVVTDNNSVTKYGVTIRGKAQSDDTSVATAENVAKTYLEEYSTPVPRAEINFENIYDASGNLFPPFLVRSGDNTTMRNVSHTSGETLNRARKFRVKRTRYNLMTHQLQIVPENDLPTLETMLANAAARI